MTEVEGQVWDNVEFNPEIVEELHSRYPFLQTNFLIDIDAGISDERAQQLYESALSCYPDNNRWKYSLARSLRKNPEVAAEILDELRKECPTTLQYHVTYAETLKETNRIEEGTAAFEQLLKQTPGDPEICGAYAEWFENIGDTDRAQWMYAQAAKCGKKHQRYEFWRSKSGLGKTTHREPSSRFSRWDTTIILAKMDGKEAEARTLLEAEIQALEAENAIDEYNIIEICEALVEFDEYERAYELGKKYGEPNYDLGIYLLELERYDEAIATFGEDVNHILSVPNTYFDLDNALTISAQLGRCYEGKGEYEKAMVLYTYSLRHNAEEGFCWDDYVRCAQKFNNTTLLFDLLAHENVGQETRTKIVRQLRAFRVVRSE